MFDGIWGEYRGKYDESGDSGCGLLALFIAIGIVFLTVVLIWR